MDNPIKHNRHGHPIPRAPGEPDAIGHSSHQVKHVAPGSAMPHVQRDPFLEERSPLDPDDPKNAAFLNELQGNILKSHGRDHSVFILLRFRKGSEQAIREQIATFAADRLTSAYDQAQAALARRQAGRAGVTHTETMFAGVYLSEAGYRALGFDENQLPPDRRFRLGMAHQDVRRWLDDPPPSRREVFYQQEIDALVLLAHAENPEEETGFKRQVEEIVRDFTAIAREVRIEYGHHNRIEVNGRTEIYEPFGYVDGISQPLFFEQELQAARRQGGPGKWAPYAPLSLVLERDPGGHLEASYGSYLVFRKLQQDVVGFHNQVEQMAKDLDISCELAGAYITGRFTDGTPLALHVANGHAYHGASEQVKNNFMYHHDPHGNRCPHQSHIRKANPRESRHTLFLPGYERLVVRIPFLRKLFPELNRFWEDGNRMERGRRIVRRGVAYREYGGDGQVVRQGLLFVCAQANIERQFEFIQAAWSNANNFLRPGTGQDAVVGQGRVQDADSVRQEWPVPYGSRKRKGFRFTPDDPLMRFVQLRGGEYFFAPSKSFLVGLGHREPVDRIRDGGIPA